MNYISFRGVRSDDLGLLIAEMPSHKRAKKRYTEYDVPGRDGPLHITEGYGAFDLQAVVTMLNAEASLRQTVNAWADGTGDLFTSDDPGKCFRASVFGEVPYGRRRWGGKFCDTAKITFRCQPFMYETTPKIYTFTQSGMIVNLGNLPSLPIITVTGSGDCSFSIANGCKISMFD
jgi:phage-related protein